MDGIVILFTLTISLNVIASLIGIISTIKLYFELDRGVPLIILMTSILTTWGLSNLFLLLGAFTKLMGSMLFFSLSQIFLVLTFSIFIYFIAIFSGDFSSIKIIAIVGYPVSIYTLWIAEIYSGTHLIMNMTTYAGMHVGYWKDFSYFVSATGILITGYWVIKGLRENLDYSYTPDQTKYLRYMQIGSIMTFLIGPIAGFPGFLFFRFTDNTGVAILFFYIIGYSIISLGVFIIAFTYNSSKEISFLLPQKIEKLLVIHNSGVSIFSHNFGTNTNYKLNDQLVSGIVMATTNAFGESLGVNTEISEIKFIDRIVMIRVKENLAFVLITKNRSQFLDDALKRFSKEFFAVYENYSSLTSVHKIIQDHKISSIVNYSFGLPN